MHDVLDIIRNVQSLYSISPSLGILKDFERVMDELMSNPALAASTQNHAG